MWPWCAATCNAVFPLLFWFTWNQIGKNSISRFEMQMFIKCSCDEWSYKLPLLVTNWTRWLSVGRWSYKLHQMVGYQLENCQINCTKCTYVCKLILSNETQHEKSKSRILAGYQILHLTLPKTCTWVDFILVVLRQMTPLKLQLHTARGCNFQSFAFLNYIIFGCSGIQIYEVRNESSG